MALTSALGIVQTAAGAGAAVDRLVTVPVRIVSRTPLVRPAGRRAEEALALENDGARAGGRGWLESVAGEAFPAPEVERTSGDSVGRLNRLGDSAIIVKQLGPER